MRSCKVLILSLLASMTMGTLAHAGPASWGWSWAYRRIEGGDANGPSGTVSVFRGLDPRPGAGRPRAPGRNVPPIRIAPKTSTQAEIITRPDPAPIPPLDSTPTPKASPASSSPDAFINFGDGPYLGSGSLTRGDLRPWYESPAVQNVFGGVPDAQQQADFTRAVLEAVERTYNLSGLDPTLTLDPAAGAEHTLSVVSGASGTNPNVIGIAEVGGDGFAFVDKLDFATTTDQLAQAVAHAVSHELMHSFGVAGHPDQTGRFLDAATSDWSLLTDPSASFSTAAARDILDGGDVPSRGAAAMVLAPTVVPEPEAIAGWAIGLLVAAFHRRRARR